MSEILGKLTIYGVDYFVDPEDYQIIYDGEPSKLIPSSNSYIMDIGYVRLGFTAKLKILNGSDLITLQTNIKNTITSNIPTSVYDTIYPNGKTWYGFFKSPVIINGVMKGGRFGLPNELNITPVTVTFYNTSMEIM